MAPRKKSEMVFDDFDAGMEDPLAIAGSEEEDDDEENEKEMNDLRSFVDLPVSEKVTRERVGIVQSDRTKRELRDIPSITVQGGKQFYQYRDVLNEAHKHGFRGFTLLHPPILTTTLDSEGRSIPVAICSVSAVFAEKDPDGFYSTVHFHGTGDATPENTGKMTAAHLVRMADTRAKARALGDALNLDANFADELSDHDRTGNESAAYHSPAPASRGGGYQKTANKPFKSSGSGLDDRLPDPSEFANEEGQYLCSVCGEELRDTEKSSAGKKAQWSIRDFGEVRCWNHGRGASSL